MKFLSVLVFFCICLTAFSSYTPSDTIINGVFIRFNYSPLIFPESWQAVPINAKGEQISSTEIIRCNRMMEKALSKYPLKNLEKELKTVYFLKSMTCYDVDFGGTNSTDALYLTNNGISNGYSDFYLEETFHHEYSSILYRNYSSFFNTKEWKRASLLGFKYKDPENGVGAIRKNQSSQHIDTVLCKKGFLTQYSLSGLENDINTFAQYMFSPPENFWEIVDRYPRIKKKVKLLTDFYHKIDSLFTDDYFRNLQ